MATVIEPALASQQVTIIVVDDRPENLIAMQAALGDPQYQLVCLTSGEHLLQYLKNADTSNLAAILLDVQMPGMDGFETANLLKSRKALQTIPIIFLTAINKTEAYMEKGYKSGAIDYIFKPINPHILRHKIQAFIRIHHYQRQLEASNSALKQKTLELEEMNRKLQHTEVLLSRANAGLESKIEKRTVHLKQAYQEIRESHSLFQSVFSMSPCLLAIRSSGDRPFLDVNDTWTAITGYTLEEMNEAGEGTLGIKALDLDTDLTHGNIRNVKVSFYTKDKQTRVGLLSKQLLQLNGSDKQLLVIMDVTDQEEWESQTARLERLHLIGEMAAAIAHEVRNPMTTIRGFLQLCRKNNEVLSEEYIDIMLEELNRANSIITEFLTLAKNKATVLTSVNLNDIILSILPLLQAEAIISGKEVQEDLAPLPNQELDEKEIRQLILNIALNGLDAMSSGGKLLLRTETNGKDIVLIIADNGPGIPDEVLAKLGTPFYTTKENGTGLGLAVCYSIASRHGAAIQVDTSQEGTSFIIRFTQRQ